MDKIGQFIMFHYYSLSAYQALTLHNAIRQYLEESKDFTFSFFETERDVHGKCKHHNIIITNVKEDKIAVHTFSQLGLTFYQYNI